MRGRAWEDSRAACRAVEALAGRMAFGLAEKEEGVVVEVGGVVLAVLLGPGFVAEAGGVERSLGEPGRAGSEEVLILVRGGVESILAIFPSRSARLVPRWGRKWSSGLAVVRERNWQTRTWGTDGMIGGQHLRLRQEEERVISRSWPRRSSRWLSVVCSWC